MADLVARIEPGATRHELGDAFTPLHAEIAETRSALLAAVKRVELQVTVRFAFMLTLAVVILVEIIKL